MDKNRALKTWAMSIGIATVAATAATVAVGGGAHLPRPVASARALREEARAAYHAVRDAGLQRAYAAQIPRERAESALVVYDDRLGDGWQDWSWAKRDLAVADAGSIHSGRRAMRMTPKSNEGVFLHHDPFSTVGYGALKVYARGAENAALNVVLVDGANKFGKPVPLAKYLKPVGRGWSVASIPLKDLDPPAGGVSGIVFQASTREARPDVYLDDLSLEPDQSLPPAPTEATIAATVDLSGPGKPIEPTIYGMAFAPKEYVTDLRLGSNRWGGNDKSRYNWVHGNACNAARDWEWRNRRAVNEELPQVKSLAADRFVRDNQTAATLITIPTIGWVAKDTDNQKQSVNVPDPNKIGDYSPAQNRERTSVRSVARRSAAFPNAVVQQDWVRYLAQTFGPAAKGGVRFYAMDNEPDLWDVTHTDIHPARMGYDDTLSMFLEYATATKEADPTALVTGPVSWGWTGYLYSARDRGDDNFRTHADRSKHGDEPFLSWFLKQVRAADVRSGRRTLDVLDIHYYPQGQNLYGSAADPDTRARRIRATRSLWDPAYVDESWIGEPIRLLPRLKDWIAAGYPGTKIGITEWNFGGDNDISGAIAISDTLGIFGRDGVLLANYWAYPNPNSPGYLAFKLFRNADNAGHGFGDRSQPAASDAADRLSVYAATESGATTLILINKMPRATIMTPITLKGWSGGGSAAKLWRVSGNASKAIAPVSDAEVGASGKMNLKLPPYSITLVRIPFVPAGAR